MSNLKQKRLYHKIKSNILLTADYIYNIKRNSLPIILISFTSCFTLTSCNEYSQNNKEATDYNEKIINIQNKADAALIETLVSLESSDKQNIIITYEINRDKTLNLLKKAQKIRSFNNNNELNKALIQLLETFLYFYDNELAELTDILIKEPQNVTNIDIEIIKNCYNNLKETYITVSSKFLKVQNKFAKDYNLILM